MNPKFKANMKRYAVLNEALKPLGLHSSQGVIIDDVLNPISHFITVCSYDYKQIDLDKPFNPMDIPEVKAWVEGGREAEANRVKKEQEEAHAWANRPQ